MSFMVAVTMIFGFMLLETKSYAEEFKLNNKPELEIFSEKFPNAYIETNSIELNEGDITQKDGEFINNTNNKKLDELIHHMNNSSLGEDYKKHTNEGKKLLTSLSGTVYVRETYETINGERKVAESRLLSKAEMEKLDISPLGFDFVDSDEDTYRKLTIRLNVFTGNTTTQRYVISGNAFWELGGTGSSIPATGDDYFGFNWGGGFDYSGAGCVVKSSAPSVSLSKRVADYIPNSGIVWAIQEQTNHLNYGFVYAEQITISTNLNKNRLTGGSNTTAVALKYIHTYEATKGSISIGVSGDKYAGSFTLTGVDKQWPLSVSVSGLSY